MTTIEIIDETLEFYSNNSRAITKLGACYYNGPDGTHCAFGRCMLPKYKELGDKLPSNSTGIIPLIDVNMVSSVDDMLEEKYHGHNIDFWRDLQEFHDEPQNWNSFKLTEKGVIKYNKLKETNYGN